jgi:outer membrane protein TolC
LDPLPATQAKPVSVPKPADAQLPVTNPSNGVPVQPVGMTLEAAIQQSLVQQPNIHAAQASLRAAMTQQLAAQSPAGLLSGPQIAARRKQADLGVAIAQANLHHAELEAVQAVTRCYLLYTYSLQQSEVLTRTVNQFDSMQSSAKSLVDAGSRDVTSHDVDRINVYQKLAESRLSKARLGMAQAHAALREAIGLPTGTAMHIQPQDLRLYHRSVQQYLASQKAMVSTELVIEKARMHRPEVAQASLLTEVVALEGEAQRLTLGFNATTFAGRSDIHAKMVNPTQMEPEYRPGAIAPEMPSVLSGSRASRTERTSALQDRASAGAVKAANLVALEAEALCLRLQEYSVQIDLLSIAHGQAAQMRSDAEKGYTADQLRTEQMIAAQVVESQTQADLNEALYNYAVTLSALQRATGGKFWECLTHRAR